MNSNKPNLFLIGAPKSATTTLAYHLEKHRDIFLPEIKEPRFFDASSFYDYPEDYPVKTMEQYLEYYNSADAKKAKYRLDASVFNMYRKDSIDNILKMSPDAKFIVILRDPAEASVSMHKQRLGYSNLKMRELSDNFMECWTMLEERKKGGCFPKGCRNKLLFRYDLLFSYEKYCPYLIETVNKSNLMIVFFEDFIASPQKTLSSIYEFLSVKTIEINLTKKNSSHVIKKSIILIALDIAIRKTLFIRQKLGLDFKLLKKIHLKIIGFYTKEPAKSTIIDESVYWKFSKTYEYLKELKRK